MFGKPSLKELESKAEQVGLLHANAYLGKISNADLADYVRNNGIRTDLRKAYAKAVADVGDKKALKAAGSAAYLKADVTIRGARAVGVAPGGSFLGILEDAKQAVLAMLTEESPVCPTVTINGRPQPLPESTGTGDRRSRLFLECVRRLIGEPLVQPEAQGHMLGRDGLKQLLPLIAPMFQHEPSMIRWVTLRGAITFLYLVTKDSPDVLVKLTEAMGLQVKSDPHDGLSVTALTPGQLSGDELDAALALGTAVYALLSEYERIAAMTIQEVNAYPASAALTDTTGLDCIVWAAVALLRIGRAQEIVQKYPEPDGLTEPGWYTEPVFGKCERYWDGVDWTPSVRRRSGHESVSLRPS